MQLVSPILNDALADAAVPGEAFLDEFQAAHRRERRWVARRSAFDALRGSNLSARIAGSVIVAEATIAEGIFVDESCSPALMRLPFDLPCTIDASLPGRALRELIGHRLISRPTSIIEHVSLSANGKQRIITYAAAPEPLR